MQARCVAIARELKGQNRTEKEMDLHSVLLLPLATYTTGVADISGRLDALQAQMNHGFEQAISTIRDVEATRTAREFRAKLNSITLAYDPLVEEIAGLVEDRNHSLSDFVKEDADKAEMRADDLYSWASAHLPSTSQAALHKRTKLELMPYIVCMAYAVRVKMDAYLVRSRLLPETRRAAYLQRATGIVDNFVRVLGPALIAVMANTSLLDVALDYHLPIATYLMLIMTLRNSAQSMVSPETESSQVEPWDDGLSGIR